MRATGTGSRLAIGAAALALFVVAIELLKTGAGSLEPLIRGVLTVSGPASSLGFGWLLAYVVLSGSPVAATAIGLFAGHLVTPLETFFMIGGSRLGAPMVVLLIGAIYRLRGASRKTSLMAGVLSLVVTFTIYVPALGLGFFLFQSGAMEAFAIGTPGEITGIIDLTAGRFAGYAIATVGGLATVLLGIGSVVAAIALFDRAIPPLDPSSGPLL